MGAAAAIFRDERGFFLGALALVIEGMSDPVTLEAIALKGHGCRLEGGGGE